MKSIRKIDNDTFLTRLSHLAREKDLIFHFRISPNGLSYSDIISTSRRYGFEFSSDTLYLLCKDGWVEEYQGQYTLSEQAQEIIKYSDPDYEVISTVNERIKQIQSRLDVYKTRLEASVHDSVRIEQDRTDIINHLSNLRRNIHNEISSLRINMETKYCNENNWNVKKMQLDYYHQQLIEIQEMIWVDKETPNTDSSVNRRTCLLTILLDNDTFTPDNYDYVNTYVDSMRILLSTELSELINTVNSHLACVSMLIDDTNHINTVFRRVAISNDKEIMNIIHLMSARHKIPPENRRTLPNIQPKKNILPLECVKDLLTPEVEQLLHTIDIDSGLPKNTVPAPRTFGHNQPEKHIHKIDKEKLYRAFAVQHQSLGCFLRQNYPTATESELVSMYMKVMNVVCSMDTAPISMGEMESLTPALKCRKIIPTAQNKNYGD